MGKAVLPGRLKQLLLQPNVLSAHAACRAWGGLAVASRAGREMTSTRPSSFLLGGAAWSYRGMVSCAHPSEVMPLSFPEPEAGAAAGWCCPPRARVCLGLQVLFLEPEAGAAAGRPCLLADPGWR